MKQKKELIVSAIQNGTVIDHIPAQRLFKVIKILNLENIGSQITFGTNLDSNQMGKKAIIKISDVFFDDNEINKIALIAPAAKLNIIRNYEVVEKKVVEIPDKIVGIAVCVNPKCITNHENIVTKFTVVSKNKVQLKCTYCEKITDHENLKLH